MQGILPWYAAVQHKFSFPARRQTDIGTLPDSALGYRNGMIRPAKSGTAHEKLFK